MSLPKTDVGESKNETDTLMKKSHGLGTRGTRRNKSCAKKKMPVHDDFGSRVNPAIQKRFRRKLLALPLSHHAS